jgi:DNA-binding NarL/FixJ family response regulator
MRKKVKVLLADDHVVLREATAELVDNQADMMVVGQAGTGEQTVALAESLQPDVIVMDVAMPRLNGLEATRLVKAKCPSTRVLVLSAHHDSEHVIPLLEAGATSYLPKTVSLNELLEAIRATERGKSVLPPSVASVVVKHFSGDIDHEGSVNLTEREMEVLKLVTDGLSNDQIAKSLHLSTRTIEAHLTHIYNKLNVSSRTEAAMLVVRKGWLKNE